MDTPVPRKLGTITKQMLTNHEVKMIQWSTPLYVTYKKTKFIMIQNKYRKSMLLVTPWKWGVP